MISKSISSVAFAALALCAGASQADTVELTTNGNFNTGTFEGWTTFPTGVQSIASDGPGHETAGYLTATGSAAATVIKQANLGIGTVTPGSTVRVEFDARASFAPGGVVFAELFSELPVTGTSKSDMLGGGPLFPSSWTHFAFDSVLGSDVGGGISLQLKIANGAGNPADFSQLWLDNVSVTATVAAVPEPETYALMLAGLIGVGAMVRRRRAV